MPKNKYDDPNFVENIHSLIGSDAKDINELLPKLDIDALVDLADAVNDKDKKRALELIKIGREKTMDEETEVDEKPRIRKRKSSPAKIIGDNRGLTFNMGDPVKYKGIEATVVIPNGPEETVGIMIKGKKEMVLKKELSEGVVGMTNIPDIRRMQELAGIASPTIAYPSMDVVGPEEPVEVSSMSDEGTDDCDYADSYEDVVDDTGEDVVDEVPSDESAEETGDMILSFLDDVKELLPNLRMAEVSNIRKKMNELLMQMNESVRVSKRKTRI